MKKRIRVKAGKNASIFSGVVGVVFVVIGVTMVIPTFGIFGIVWTLLAVGMAGMHFYNAFSAEGVTSHQIIVDDGAETAKPILDEVESRLRFTVGLLLTEGITFGYIVVMLRKQNKSMGEC